MSAREWLSGQPAVSVAGAGCRDHWRSSAIMPTPDQAFIPAPLAGIGDHPILVIATGHDVAAGGGSGLYRRLLPGSTCDLATAWPYGTALVSRFNLETLYISFCPMPLFSRDRPYEITATLKPGQRYTNTRAVASQNVSHKCGNTVTGFFGGMAVCG